MKVKLKSVLRTTDTLFEPFEENQYVFHAGNTLTIKQFHKPSCDFIHLNKDLTQLYSFKPTPNKQGCFVAQKIGIDKICISLYQIKKQRRTVCLTDSHNFFPYNSINSVELLVDQFDSYLVYGYAKAGSDCCIFLIDFNKLKIISMGFVGLFNDIKVNCFQNLTLSFCYGNTLKSAHIYNGFWEIEERVIKKLGSASVIKHEILPNEIVLMCTKSQIYFVNDCSQINQTINVFEGNNDEIQQILKLTKGILVLTKKQKIKIYVEDNDEMNYLYRGEVLIKLNQNQKVSKIALSSNCQEVLLRTTLNQIFVWKVEELEVVNEIVYEFQKVENPTIAEPKGTLSLASGKQTALLATDNTISLWDLQRNAVFLQTHFNKFDNNSQKAIYSAAINPDGNSLICAFQDKVKIYKVLLTQLRFIGEFNVKKCSYLLYSHGGQYVVCRYGKGANSCLLILNTLRMSQIVTIKIHAQPNNIVWNQMDNQLYVSTNSSNNNLVTVYRISDNSKLYTIKIPSEITLIRIDYITKKLLVSCENQIFVIDRDKIEKKFQPPLKFTFVYPLHGVYFMATKNGNLYWSNQLTFETYQEIPIFTNSPFNLNYRNGYMLAFQNFQNIMILQCLRQNLPQKKQILKTSQSIVFVQRDQINRFLQKIKNLESSLEALQGATTQRLEEQKRKYQMALQENTLKFQTQIAYLKKRNSEITHQKLKQEKQSSRVFQDLQFGQIKCVNDIEKMYDRKLKLEKQKCLEFQQKNIEQKVHYEKVIYELEKRYHQDIASIREEYSNKLAHQFKRIEDNKKNELQYKKKMEYKLISVEEQSELTMFEIQVNKDKEIKELKNRIVTLQNQENSNKVEFHNQLNRYKKMEQTFIQIQQELKKHKQKLAQDQQRIKLLTTQVENKNRMIAERNNVITQQEHQIGGLQKAKYVLSFRTTETRKEIQPKESLIEKLKKEMFKLQGQFKEEKKRVFELTQRLEKIDKLNQILKEENIQMGFKLKNKIKVHDEMSGEIFSIVNQMDPKEWPAALIKLYQTYIKEDHFKNMKKKTQDDTSQQINRHLIHVEQQLLQVKAGNQKLFRAKDLDVKRKMKQNADLILDFNQLKKSYDHSLKIIDEYKIKVSKLQQQIHQITGGSSRAQTAKSARRIISRQKGDQKIDFSNIELSLKKQSQIQFEKRQNTTRESRSRASSIGYRTMVLRSDKKQNSRFFDLAKQLENAKYKIQKQQKMIEQLNQRILNQNFE